MGKAQHDQTGGDILKEFEAVIDAMNGKPDSREMMSDFLAKVEDAICVDRNTDYGPPEVNHERTALLWSAYLGHSVTARQVCVLNILQKCSRDAHLPKLDNLTDIAGWAANGSVCG